MTSFDAKEQVRQATDIVELVGRYLDLRRQGRHFVGLCPWHNDRKPSLTVNQDRQTWKCWVCDIGGDVFSFVMQKEGCDFREALQMLADRAGIQLSPHGQRRAEPGSPDDKNTLLACCELVERSRATIVGISVLIELCGLNGRQRVARFGEVHAVIRC